MKPETLSKVEQLAVAHQAGTVADSLRLLQRTSDAADRDYSFNERLREAQALRSTPGMLSAPPAAAVEGEEMGIRIDSPDVVNHHHYPATPAASALPLTVTPAAGGLSTLAKAAAIAAAMAAGGVPAGLATYWLARPAATPAAVAVPGDAAAAKNWEFRLMPAER